MLRVSSLTRRYGDFTAVEDCTFEIGPGEIVGLLGHNGAGKTTIMKMLTGYLEPSGGRIEIDGMDIVIRRAEVQSRIGYLPENDPLYPEMTVIDYLDYAACLHGVPAAQKPERIRDAIRQTDLRSKAADAIATLSRGYRQRVGVAQAILHRPRLLILDEPTNGLDPTQVQQMRELIRSLAKDATVILSTHILQEVQAVCDRVIILRNGHIALDAGMDALRSGKRLLVSVDAGPERALPLLGDVAGVRAVEPIGAQDFGHRYALDLNGDDALQDMAPAVAARVAAEGLKLYALQPENRDLETIFGEISAR
ncbi:MAG: ATP-binding cassette domain-containing protein [Chromatiales bacterium]|nr:ATP-binding cassette domain-containing protein [Chromatiales bacterium]